MKKEFLHIGLFFVILFAVDRIVGYGISQGAQAREYDKRLKPLVENTFHHKNIIIGSSRALINADAKQLSTKLNRDFYNLGFSGANLEFQAYIIELVLNSERTPDSIFLFVDEFKMFTGAASAMFRSDFLKPYINHNSIYSTHCERSDKSYWSGLISSTYRQNENTKAALNYVFEGVKPPDNTSNVNEYGSILIQEQSPAFNKKKGQEKKNYVVENEKPELIEAFHTIFAKCKNNDVKLVLVYPPNFRTPSQEFKTRLRSLMPYSIPEIILDDLPLNESDFFDHGHLRQQGTEKFTRALAQEIHKL